MLENKRREEEVGVYCNEMQFRLMSDADATCPTVNFSHGTLDLFQQHLCHSLICVNNRVGFVLLILFHVPCRYSCHKIFSPRGAIAAQWTL